jgi:hypothetical protein
MNQKPPIVLGQRYYNTKLLDVGNTVYIQYFTELAGIEFCSLSCYFVINQERLVEYALHKLYRSTVCPRG